MGRIKTMLVKRTTVELLEKHNSEFSGDFTQNKTKVSMFINAPSKKIRNIIAGYITRLKKKQETEAAA